MYSITSEKKDRSPCSSPNPNLPRRTSISIIINLMLSWLPRVSQIPILSVHSTKIRLNRALMTVTLAFSALRDPLLSDQHERLARR